MSSGGPSFTPAEMFLGMRAQLHASKHQGSRMARNLETLKSQTQTLNPKPKTPSRSQLNLSFSIFHSFSDDEFWYMEHSVKGFRDIGFRGLGLSFSGNGQGYRARGFHGFSNICYAAPKHGSHVSFGLVSSCRLFLQQEKPRRHCSRRGALRLAHAQQEMSIRRH